MPGVAYKVLFVVDTEVTTNILADACPHSAHKQKAPPTKLQWTG
jgi:hypothetical protein